MRVGLYLALLYMFAATGEDIFGGLALGIAVFEIGRALLSLAPGDNNDKK